MGGGFGMLAKALLAASMLVSMLSGGAPLEFVGGCATDAEAVAMGGYYLHPTGYLYQESNGLPGLQRGGGNSPFGAWAGLAPDAHRWCGTPDTLVV